MADPQLTTSTTGPFFFVSHKPGVKRPWASMFHPSRIPFQPPILSRPSATHSQPFRGRLLLYHKNLEAYDAPRHVTELLRVVSGPSCSSHGPGAGSRPRRARRRSDRDDPGRPAWVYASESVYPSPKG